MFVNFAVTVHIPLQFVDDEWDTDTEMDADFDTTTMDADYADMLAGIENRIIKNLDHAPTKEELVNISIEAQKIATEFDDTTLAINTPLPASYSMSLWSCR